MKPLNLVYQIWIQKELITQGYWKKRTQIWEDTSFCKKTHTKQRCIHHRDVISLDLEEERSCDAQGSKSDDFKSINATRMRV